MRTRYSDGLEELQRAVLDGPGQLDPAVRQTAFSGSGVLSSEAAPFVDKLRRHAYKVTDEDVAGLLEARWTQDQVFELTLATALGEGRRRIDVALAALEEA